MLEQIFGRCTRSVGFERVADSRADERTTFRRRAGGTCDGDKEFASELIGTFETSSEQSLQQIQAALASNDLAAAQRAAHSLKGAAGSIGAMIARGVAADLEDAAKDGDSGKAALLLDALRGEIARANEYLHRKLEAA
jgi:HPt (histidine-containing phosphotransfer) domain-containing protein